MLLFFKDGRIILPDLVCFKQQECIVSPFCLCYDIAA